LEAATCSVRPAIGKGVLFDMRDWIKSAVSVSRDTLKSTLMLELVTVISLLVSGTEEANVHSSSSLVAVAVALLCARFDVGVEMAPPRRSIAPDAVDGGFMDCWYWKGEPCRGVEANAAKGSGERAGATED
jgi:hypothetical protein